MKNNEKGRSMIEMLGVLAIIGVLSVGGIAGYSKAMSKFRANKTIDQVSHIVANTRILFGSQKNYADLDTTKDSVTTATVANLVYNAHIFPDEMVGSAVTDNKDPGTFDVYNNPYGGAVDLFAGPRFVAETGSAGTDATKAKKAFILVYKGIPRDACIDLASQNWDSSSGSGLLSMSINDAGASLKAAKSCYDDCADTATSKHTCYSSMPMSVAKATTLCSKNLDNDMAWKFY